MQRRVKVHGKTHWVTVHPHSDWFRSKPVWYVMAEYEGEELFAGARSEREALRKWIAMAEAKQTAPPDRGSLGPLDGDQ